MKLSATKAGVVYDKDTFEVRRVIIPDDDSQLTTANFCGPTEGLTTYPIIFGFDLKIANEAVEAIRPK